MANFILQAQQISNFEVTSIKWYSWKKKTRVAVGTAGMLKILNSHIYVSKSSTDNETIFHLLQVTTADGNAAHLVGKYEDERD